MAVVVDLAEFPPATGVFNVVGQVEPWSREDLLLAAILVGRPVQSPLPFPAPPGLSGAQLYAMGVQERQEAAGLLTLLDSYLSWDGPPTRTSQHFRRGLTRTDRDQASNRLGMGAANLLAARILGSPYSVHAEVLEARGHLHAVWTGGIGGSLERWRKRPDLIGWRADRQTWALVEAKGSASLDEHYKRRVLRDAKAQTMAVARVGESGLGHGSPGAIELRVATLAHLAETPLRIQAVDPPGDETARNRVARLARRVILGKLRMQIAPALLVYEFYSFARRLLQLPPIDGDETSDAALWRLSDRWTIGVTPPIAELLLNESDLPPVPKPEADVWRGGLPATQVPEVAVRFAQSATATLPRAGSPVFPTPFDGPDRAIHPSGIMLMRHEVSPFE